MLHDGLLELQAGGAPGADCGVQGKKVDWNLALHSRVHDLPEKGNRFCLVATSAQSFCGLALVAEKTDLLEKENQDHSLQFPQGFPRTFRGCQQKLQDGEGGQYRSGSPWLG